MFPITSRREWPSSLHLLVRYLLKHLNELVFVNTSFYQLIQIKKLDEIAISTWMTKKVTLTTTRLQLEAKANRLKVTPTLWRSTYATIVVVETLKKPCYYAMDVTTAIILSAWHHRWAKFQKETGAARAVLQRRLANRLKPLDSNRWDFYLT